MGKNEVRYVFCLWCFTAVITVTVPNASSSLLDGMDCVIMVLYCESSLYTNNYHFFLFSYRMVRTKADAGATKVAGAKAPRKVLAPSPAGPSSSAGTPNKASR